MILDFHDSYTRNLLSLFSQLGQLEPHRQTDLEQPQGRDRLSEAQTYVWDTQGWKERVVVVNVDSVTWCVKICCRCSHARERTLETFVDPALTLQQGSARTRRSSAYQLRHSRSRTRLASPQT